MTLTDRCSEAVGQRCRREAVNCRRQWQPEDRPRQDPRDRVSHVVDEGTARRAIVDGIRAAGKTGTTNTYRDARFVGFTGNFVCGVWFGNDDYKAMNQMTGGSLPAQTWHDIMA